MARRSTRSKTYLTLVASRDSWIHRKVETIDFLPDGSTRNKISYDFTAPLNLKPFAKGAQIGIPITLMKKNTLVNLSVKDANSKSLSVWDTQSTGDLGFEILRSVIVGFIKRPLNNLESESLNKIVFSKPTDQIEPQLQVVENALTSNLSGSPIALEIIRGFITSLIENYIFVVEIPISELGSRQIIKISHDQELLGGMKAEKFWLLRVKFLIPRNTFLPSAKSSHLEINSPEGVQILGLDHSTYDVNSKTWLVDRSSETSGHVAHIHINEDFYSASKYILRMSPSGSGLILQTFVGISAGLAYYFFILKDICQIDSLITTPSEAAGLATISLAIPAFLLTQVSRAREHSHVQRILRIPRVIALLSSVCFFISAGSLVIGMSRLRFLDLSRGLSALQLALWVAIYVYMLDCRWFAGFPRKSASTVD